MLVSEFAHVGPLCRQLCIRIRLFIHSVCINKHLMCTPVRVLLRFSHSYPPDVVRLFAMRRATFGGDLKFSELDLKRMNNKVQYSHSCFTCMTCACLVRMAKTFVGLIYYK